MTAHYHLPGLFEFYEFYRVFLPLWQTHRDYFYDWCDIGSIYGAPTDCLWGGGRIEQSDADPEDVLALTRAHGISARLTFSNSLLKEEHLSDRRCNALCELFEADSRFSKQKTCIADTAENGISDDLKNGVIVHSDLLLDYLRSKYPGLYFVSSTTKVILDFKAFQRELEREEFLYAVPDFRLNKQMEQWHHLPDALKDKVEFLCNECCYFGCRDRKACYEDVSRKALGEASWSMHRCTAPDAGMGYRFSKAMKNPGFISVGDIVNIYLPMGFSNFKIEGRGLGSALLLEFILYYMTKPECQLVVREELYLDNTLDLF